MAEQFYFVEALESGVWRHHEQLIVALVDAKWCIDGKGVDVLPGVVYPFQRDEDAHYFLALHENERGGQPRAMPLVVEKGAMVTFWRESDAEFFVAAGKARRMSDAEVSAVFAAANGDAAPAVAAPVVEPEAHDDTDDAHPDAPATVTQAKPRGKRKAHA